MSQDMITLNSRLPEFVIYPRGSYVADGLKFHTAVGNITHITRPEVGTVVSKAEILHTWWRSLSHEEVVRMFNDGITLDRIIQKFDVLQLGK